MSDAPLPGTTVPGARPRLVLATHNAHKVAELRSILGPLLDGIDLIAYDGPDPVEDGDTFAANALIKARAASAHTGLPAIADDSGICVDALGGAPGIHSARYAGTRDDDHNVDLLLANLAGVSARGARFECAAALVVPLSIEVVGPDGPADASEGSEFVETGSWPGTVLGERRGAHGFGYDPVFAPHGAAGSAAELTPEQKNAVSHRAIAFGRLISTVRVKLGV